MSVNISRRRLVQASAGMAILPTQITKAGQATPVVVVESQALVTMSPQHGSLFALPGTTITIRDVTLDQIGNIYVSGSLSGPAHGVIREHSDGNGVTWQPDAEFFETETVTVTADVPLTDGPEGLEDFGNAIKIEQLVLEDRNP